MQSPNATSATTSSIGYYLWLAAIGAIVYAYVFATSRAEMANTTLTPTVDASGNIINDPATGKPMMNTGHRVIMLLPFVWLYAVIIKAYTLFTIQTAGPIVSWVNFILTVGTLIGLVFLSIRATVVEAKAAARANEIEKINEEIKTLNNNIKNITGNTDADIKSKLNKIEELKTVLKNAEKDVNDAEKDIGYIFEGSERTGWVTTNIVLGISVVVGPLVYGLFKMRSGFMEPFSGLLSKMSNFVFNFWFPFMMMVYFVKTGATDWFRIVAVISIVLAIAYNIYNANIFNIFSNKEPMKDWRTTLLESLKYLAITSPLLTYLKYVEGTELNEVAKRVVIFALLMYVAYLMNSVYKFKNRLVPCVSSSFDSCFWNPDFKQGKYYDPSKTTPYVNALFYTLMMSMGVNILNFFLQIWSVYRRISEAFFLDKDSTESSVWDRLMLEHIKPKPPSWQDNFSLVTFIQMIIFPFFWIFKLFAQHPIVTIIAFIAFAALGLFLYRTSFDLTDFIEGQRGTVITVFTLFIASLVLFGAYIATNKPSSATSSKNANNAVPSYAEFIGRPVMLMAVALCVIGIVTYLLTSQSRMTLMAGLLQYAITALIYIGAIAVLIGVVRTVFSTSRKMGDPMFQISPDSNWVINVVKLLGNALFYLPCLMLDTVDMLKEQYKLTSSTFLLILAAEAAFILAGLYLPALATKAINHTGVQIVSAPISMSHETTLSKYQIQFVKSNNTDVKEWSGKANPLQPFAKIDTTKINTNIDPPPSDPNSSIIQLHNYSYGVSAWVYIHPQPPNVYKNKTMNIFNFGKTIGPDVSYDPGTNAIIVSIRMSNNNDVVVATITDAPLQRWNNIVVNSDKGAIDIFINGKLIYTGTHVPDTAESPLTSIVVGQGKTDKNNEVPDKGISGEICNLVLNREPFTSPEIAWFYKTNKSLNPPVVGANQDNQGEATKQETKQTVTDTTAESSTPNNPLSFSTYGARTYGIIGVVLGALFGWLFNDGNTSESVKGLGMGAIVFGLIGALLGALFSTDGTVAYVFKTVANVFVNTF
jgi:hypothetical protein